MDNQNHLWSAEDFLEHRFDLPESGQWSELIAGQLVHLQPPDLDHGNTLLNLSKMLADYAQTASGYACFDLGLMLQRNPDTIWFPAVSYYVKGDRFAELDREVTETIPGLVIEFASTPDRRAQMPARVRGYLDWGVPSVWVIDPAAQTVELTSVHSSNRPDVVIAGDLLKGEPVLHGFQVSVADLFSEPAWWT